MAVWKRDWIGASLGAALLALVFTTTGCWPVAAAVVAVAVIADKSGSPTASAPAPAPAKPAPPPPKKWEGAPAPVTEAPAPPPPLRKWEGAPAQAGDAPGVQVAQARPDPRSSGSDGVVERTPEEERAIQRERKALAEAAESIRREEGRLAELEKAVAEIKAQISGLEGAAAEAARQRLRQAEGDAEFSRDEIAQLKQKRTAIQARLQAAERPRPPRPPAGETASVSAPAPPPRPAAPPRPAQPVDARGDTFYQQGVDAFNKGDYAGAVKFFQQFVDKHPTEAVGHEYLQKAKDLDRASQYGSLKVDCNVSAEVYLDGRGVGRTPLNLSEVKVGSYRLEARYMGRTVSQSVTIKARTASATAFRFNMGN